MQVTIVGCVALLCFCADGMRTKIGDVARMMETQKVDAMRNDDPHMSMSPSTTVDGCTCTEESKCASSIDGGWSCDWCWVQGDACGKSNTLGYRWDYCQYPEMAPYEAQPASQKLDQLWGKITAADVVGKSAELAGLFTTVTTVIGESMRTPFDTHWDVLPEGRVKVIHAQGAHCKFDLDVVASSPYTGLLAPGKQTGIIRMGSATPVTGAKPFPGLSFKFLRSGVHSGNFVALRASGPDGGGFKFFDQEFSNHVNPPEHLKALMKFQDASNCISMVGLSDVCSHAQDGTPAKNINFPFNVLFDAGNGEIMLPDANMTDDQMVSHLSSIKAGTRLFNVYAKASPTADKVRLGTLTTTSDCVKSVFGDGSLFFRHQRMEEDFVKRPDWVKDVTEVTGPGCNAVAAASSQWQCPGVH